MASFDILAGPIPLHQGSDGQPVTEVVETRPVAGSWATQPNLSRQTIKRAPHFPAIEAIPSFGDKEIKEFSDKSLVPLLNVVPENLSCGRMDRDQSGLAELGSADGQNTFRQIDILWLEIQGLTDTHACHR